MLDDVSFAIVLELKDNAAPTVSSTKVCTRILIRIRGLKNFQDLPPWIPAETQHTTSGASENAELYMLRVVNTGVVNASLLRFLVRV